MVRNNFIKMKNVFFSLAFLLIGSFVFANTSSQLKLDNSKIISIENYSSIKSESHQDLGTCYVSISAYDEDGNKLKTWVLQFDDVASAEDCDQIGAMVEKVLSSF
jgi:uncharacterized protein YxeA